MISTAARPSPKCFFVCGYNALGSDTYKELLEYLPNTTSFVYENADTIEEIEKRLFSEYSAGEFDWIVGHSMGCFLISRMLHYIPEPKKVLFLNPFILPDQV